MRTLYTLSLCLCVSVSALGQASDSLKSTNLFAGITVDQSSLFIQLDRKFHPKGSFFGQASFGKSGDLKFYGFIAGANYHFYQTDKVSFYAGVGYSFVEYFYERLEFDWNENYTGLQAQAGINIKISEKLIGKAEFSTGWNKVKLGVAIPLKKVIE